MHHTDRLDPVDVSRRRGIPVTAPARTPLDLAGVVDLDELGPALEDAVLPRLAPFPMLRCTLERLGCSRRRGAASLPAVLDARDPRAAPTESVLEDALVRVLRRAGLPEPVRQHRVGRVRLDLAYPDVRLGIEADSRGWHGGGSDVQRNSSKRLLVGAGRRVLHFTWSDVRTRPAYVVATVGGQLAHVA